MRVCSVLAASATKLEAMLNTDDNLSFCRGVAKTNVQRVGYRNGEGKSGERRAFNAC